MIKIFRFLKPYWIWVVTCIVLVFIQNMADLKLPDLMSNIINNGVIPGDIPEIWRIGGIMLLVALLDTASGISAGYFASRSGAFLGRDLRKSIFHKVENFSLTEIDKFSTPSLITRSTNDVQQIQMFTIMLLRMVITAPIKAIGGVVMGIGKSPDLTWILVVVIPLIGLLVGLVISRSMPLFKAMQSKLDQLNLVMREGLTGVRVIRAFRRDKTQTERFEAANQDLTSVGLKVNRIVAVMMPVMMLIFNMTTVAIIWFSSGMIDAQTLNIGDMMAFIQYAMQILFAFMMFSLVFILWPRASASASRIEEVLASETSVKDPAQPQTASGSGRVEFKDVTFYYPGAEMPAVKNISFHADPGETVAIIGGTGSGKSTLANLLLRFYDPQEGSISLGDVNIRDLTQNDLRAQIGYVPQKAVIFSGTIADNIRFGSEAVTDDEVETAAKTAQSESFIDEKEDKYQAHIAQGGTNISGGQKQRLAIARAIAKHPPIFLFDDCFSALDFKTDATLRAALKKETAGSAKIIIAQRISTIMNADRIVVLNDGEIAGIGRHRDLLKSCPVYNEIALSQLPKEELQ